MKKAMLGQFHNFPQRKAQEDYKNAKIEVVERVGGFPTSIYQFGSDSPHPGISDLDIQLIYPDNTFVRYVKLSEFSTPTRHILKHGIPHPMPESLFSLAHYFLVPHTLESFRIISGRDLKKELRFQSEIERDITLLMLAAEVVAKVAARAVILASDTSFDVISLLSLVSGFRYSPLIHKTENVIAKKATNEFTIKVNELRKNWFEKEQFDNLTRLQEVVDDFFYLLELTVSDLGVEIENAVFGGFHDVGESIVMKNKKGIVGYEGATRDWSLNCLFSRGILPFAYSIAIQLMSGVPKSDRSRYENLALERVRASYVSARGLDPSVKEFSHNYFAFRSRYYDWLCTYCQAYGMFDGFPTTVSGRIRLRLKELISVPVKSYRSYIT